MSESPSSPTSGDPENGSRKIPAAVIKRLSLYARLLQSLEFQNITRISSAELGRRLGMNAAQVRKDLACFGQFGVPGLGYYVADLRVQLRKILRSDSEVRVILIGVGNLGSALLSYGGFLKQGFTMLWGFDVDPVAARSRVRSAIEIFSIDDLEKRLIGQQVDIAVLTVPADAAQAIATRLAALGVQAILNFTPSRLDVPKVMQVRYVDLALELENLSYYVQS